MAASGGSERVLVAVLAAGSSRRFGSDKRLFALDDQPLLQRTLATPLVSGLDTLLVLRPGDEPGLPSLLGPWFDCAQLQIDYCERADQGMGYSLACAANYAIAHDYDAMLVMLGDMPLVKPATLQQLIAAHAPGQITVPRFQHRPGHPVLFSRHWFAELAGLSGDRGGRILLDNHPDSVVPVAVADEGVVVDFDRPPTAPVRD